MFISILINLASRVTTQSTLQRFKIMSSRLYLTIKAWKSLMLLNTEIAINRLFIFSQIAQATQTKTWAQPLSFLS